MKDSLPAVRDKKAWHYWAKMMNCPGGVAIRLRSERMIYVSDGGPEFCCPAFQCVAMSHLQLLKCLLDGLGFCLDGGPTLTPASVE